MTKRFEEWDLIGELGEKILAAASKFQELKLALVHREIQRMADDKTTEVSFTPAKRDSLRKAYDKAQKDEAESFTWEGNEYLVTYARYLLEYLDQVFGEAA